MSTGLRPLSTGQVLDRSFQIYRKNFALFAGISAVPQVFVLFIQLGFLSLTLLKNAVTMGIAAIVLGLLTLVVSVAMNAIATAATTFAVSDLYLDRPTTINSCFRRVKGKTWNVVLVSIEYGLRVGLGVLLLLIPGLYFMGKWGLAVPVVVLEDGDRKKVFPRAAELSKDSVGRVLVVYFLAWLLVLGISIGASALLAMIAPSLTRAAGTMASQAAQYVLAAVINTAVTPVMSIALTVLYYDQRVRKEAFDIQTLMAMIAGPTSPNEIAAAATTGN